MHKKLRISEQERKDILYQDWLEEYNKWEQENAQETTDE